MTAPVLKIFQRYINDYRNQAGSDPRRASEHLEELLRFNGVVVGPLLTAVKVRPCLQGSTAHCNRSVIHSTAS